MKKRFLSLVLALCVACSLTVPTWAAGTDWNDALGDLAGSGNETLYILMILNSATDAKNGVVTSEDGSTVQLAYACGTDGWYLQVEGDTSVYTVDTSTVQALLLTENDLKTQE